jgi:tetratricopeptide (TPR) repeat protein
MAELLSYFRQLPKREAGEEIADWSQRIEEALAVFRSQTAARYTEGTLQRLLHARPAELRQAATLAVGLLGTMTSNKPLARMLRDRDEAVRALAADALWSLWFRGDKPENVEELQRLRALSTAADSSPDEILSAFEALLRKAPKFAEAYNQRAILYYRLGEWQNAIVDCERVLKLNPYHFGAAGGMAQCFLKQKKMRLALKAYRRAYQLNPNLDGVQQTIRSLERLLGEEGKRG